MSPPEYPKKAHMTYKKAYSGIRIKGSVAFRPEIYRLLIVLFLLLLCHHNLRAQDEPPYDEVSVYIKVAGTGGGEIEAAIKNEELYLPVIGLFDFLKIRNVPSEDLDLITGFFISPEAEYIIDRRNNLITLGDKTYQLEEGDLVRSETNLYLRAVYFGNIFGLDCIFNFRELSVLVESRLELPIIREMRQEEMRRNVSRLKGDIVVDTTIGRYYPGFRFGMADWSVYAIEQVNGPAEARLNLALGAVIAGGEATASLYYNTGERFSEKQQYYLWKHVNNDRILLRQVMAGKIVSNATASIYNPVVGIQLTNTPTTFRRSFGEYTLSDRTEPGWTVELYVNGVLVDYVKADASGFFTFNVPLVYGNTIVKLKFYGPWGEERVKEQNIIIPYNFLPKNTFEYTFSAGVVEDAEASRYSRASVSYGATRSLTLGGGIEYLSSVTSGPFMPYIDASLRITNNLLLGGEYTYGVRTKGILTYRLPSNIQLDLNYILYDKNQTAISYNYLEERRASLSLPVRIKKFSAFSRFSYYQVILPLSDYTNAEWMIAGTILGIHTNMTNYAHFVRNAGPYYFGNLSMRANLPAGFMLMPQIQYSISDAEILSLKATLEKRFFEKIFVNLSYEQNFKYNFNIGEIGIRYDFSFAQTGFTARESNKRTSLVEYARGSLIHDGETKYLKTDNRTNVGRGGFSIVAFLDLNANGIRDRGEPRAQGLNIHSSGGRVERSDKDTTIHVLGLEPYVKYFLELDENSFDNISWRIDKKTIAVIADANMLKLIEVPVTVKGEATGTVSIEEDGTRRGLGRVIVNILSYGNVVAGRALTEEDGYFSFFGLAPGSYYARIDTTQLRKLNLTSEPDSVSFSITANTEGDYVEGVDFTLRKIVPPADTLKVPVTIGPEVQKDTTYMVVHEVTRELVTITEDYYAVQFGAFQNKVYAEIMKNKVQAALDKNVELFEEDGFWKVRITGFKDRDDLNAYIPVIQGQGIMEIWVIMNRAVKVGYITTTREDSIARVRETVIERPEPVNITGTTIQLGTYIQADETSSVVDRLLAAAESLVTVRNEDGVYKVQITLADTSEVREILPVLRKYGFDNIVIIPDQGIEIVGVTPAEPAPAVEIAVPEPEVIEEAPVVLPPRFLLHAASYYKRSQALRAKNKIERKLKLPVEILQEWNSYRVVITGFFNREETYPYYPELAGMGFNDVFVIERPADNK
jgi:hypothetical protein